jgi:hypothetical protein
MKYKKSQLKKLPVYKPAHQQIKLPIMQTSIFTLKQSLSGSFFNWEG